MTGTARHGWLALMVLALGATPAHGIEALQHELVRGDPAAATIIQKLQALGAAASMEVLAKHREVNPVTGSRYTVLKVRDGQRHVTSALNESSGAFAPDPALPDREAEQLLATLGPVYRRMGFDLLAAVRQVQGGTLGSEVGLETPIDVTFYADSEFGLDVVQATLGDVPSERFDAAALYALNPPIIRPDNQGVLPPVAPAPEIRTVSARLPLGQILVVGGSAPVTRIEKTLVGTSRLNVSVPRIRMDLVKSFDVAGFSLSGATADIGIVDTGVDDTHPNLTPSVIAEMDFTNASRFCVQGADNGVRCTCAGGACAAGACVGGPDHTFPCVNACALPGLCEGAEDDVSGHGTHVAGITINDDGTFEGMATGAEVINAKAIGRGTVGETVTAGAAPFTAALAFSRNQGADVINGSYGFAGCTGPGMCRRPGMCTGPGICAAPLVCTAGNVGSPCANNAACDNPPASGNGICRPQNGSCLNDPQCDVPPGAGNGSCQFQRTCTAPVAGNQCVVNAQCDAPAGAGNGVCGSTTRLCILDTACDVPAGANNGVCGIPRGCTAPAGSVGRPCIMNSDCDSAPAAGDGVCGVRSRLCQVNGDCDVGAANGSCVGTAGCLAPAGALRNPCLLNRDCGVGGLCALPRPCRAGMDAADCNFGGLNGVCSTPPSDGSSVPSRDVDWHVFANNITVVVAAEELGFNGRCVGAANPGIVCGDDLHCTAPDVCQAFASAPNDAFNAITVGSSHLTAGAAPPPSPSTVSNFSQVGPIAGGRSKPDIIAPGSSPDPAPPAPPDGIDSTAHNWEPTAGDADDFTDKEGTSMAAPHIAGLAAVLWDYGTTHGLLADTPYLKAVILNNATRLAGPPVWNRPSNFQPLDTSQGTGEVEAADTFQAYADDLRVWQQRVLQTPPDDTHWYYMDVPSTAPPIVVTLVFERQITDPTNPAPPRLNDLDLRVFDPGGTDVARSVSSVDSVEHIVYQPPVGATGRYCVQVRGVTFNTGTSELYAVAANRRMRFNGTVNPCIPDFGDAPDPMYPTLAASNGARHLDWTKEWLGTFRNEIVAEVDKAGNGHGLVSPFPSVSGERDANDLNDQDGVVNLIDRDGFDDGIFPGTFMGGVPNKITVEVESTVDETGIKGPGRYDKTVAAKRLYVNAWADWNGNGSWADAGEKIIGVGSPNPGNEIDPQDFGPDGEFTIGEAFPDPNGSGRWEPGEPFTDEAGFTEGSKEFTVTPPATISGTFFLRFRLDYGEDAGRLANVSGNLAQEKGAAQFGEVEDYQVSVPDHYLCYTSTTMDEKPPIVTLEDQFETAMFQPRRCRPKSFCTPAAKNGVPITDPVTHLKAYKIRRLQPGPEPQVTADVTNQFGTLRVQTVRALRMLVPSSKGLTEMPPSPDPAAPGFEHYKCYRIRVLGQVVGGVVTGRFAPIAVSSIGDQFDDARDDVQLRRVTTLCTPASKNGSTVRDRNRHLLCYSMRRSNDPGKVFVNNQFGPQEMNVKGESAFCVPSLKTLVP